MTETVSNPWNILPIKNAKSARNCVEVHLSNQNIEKIGNFESFPNLEVLWLNENKVLLIQIRKIENLDSCFRIKHLYIENNSLTSIEGSLKKFKFLQTLLAGNNNLRGLDKILKILSKLTCIERLSKKYSDLYGNPCAEEPYYRQKVIVALPNLKIFDRHEVTYAERTRSEQVIERLQETGGRPPKTKKVYDISTGERDLAKEVKKIKETQAKTLKEEEKKNFAEFEWEKFKDFPAPIAKKVKTNALYFGLCQEDRISEWEKNEIKKIFWNYDKDKSGFLDFEEMACLLKDVKDNKAGIGKVPVSDVESIIEVMRNWEKSTENKVSWKEFRDNMNSFSWKLCDPDLLREEIQALYAKAKREEMNGRSDSAKQLCMMALRLEGLDTRTKPIFNPPKEKKKEKFNTDTFFVYKFKESLRNVGAKTIYNATKPLELDPQMLVL